MQEKWERLEAGREIGNARGSHTAYTGLAAEPSSVVSAKGMSWPRSASFMVKNL